MNTASKAGNFEIGKILRLPAFFVCERGEKMTSVKTKTWNIMLDRPPRRRQRGPDKHVYRRKITPFHVFCRHCQYRWTDCSLYRCIRLNNRKYAGRILRSPISMLFTSLVRDGLAKRPLPLRFFVPCGIARTLRLELSLRSTMVEIAIRPGRSVETYLA